MRATRVMIKKGAHRYILRIDLGLEGEPSVSYQIRKIALGNVLISDGTWPEADSHHLRSSPKRKRESRRSSIMLRGDK